MSGLLALGAVSAASPALARGEPAKIAVGVTAGTLGVGPEASFALSPAFVVRGNATFFTLSHDFDSDYVHYDGKAKFGSAGLMLDYHVAGSGFFLSAGARLNKNKARATATPTDAVTIGDGEYTPAQVGTLKARADFTPIAPVASLGYSGHLTKGFKIGIEAGAMLQGSARVEPISYTGTLIDPQDLEDERKSLRDDLHKYKVFPILQLSAAYHF
ncbi:hypothetical protein ACU5AX_09650 [Sphingomonas sp. XXL09]|uniref:hypothetical protein n=1 Tax=Sphingomonas sp. XXL09 TaxID=3457787 RepID=UPI00406BD0B2